jgi:hypothetical protein
VVRTVSSHSRQSASDVVVDGATKVSVGADSEWETATRTIGFRCTSGDWIEAEWTGVPVARLIAAASVPSATTHLVVEATDDYRACLPIRACLDALLAFDGKTTPASDHQTAASDSFPRFVAPDVGGPRAVQSVARLAAVRLAANESRSDYEHLPT